MTLWRCVTLSHSLFCSMVLDSSICTFAVVCIVSKQCLTCVVQKIDAQAIEEFYGLTSDISKNSESGYILFYQSREWLELDQWHRRRLNRMRPFFFVFVFYLQPNRPRLLPSPSHPAPILQVRPLWRMCQSSVPTPTSGFHLYFILSVPLSVSLSLSLYLSLCVICFLPFSHLHLDCTLKQKRKCSTAWRKQKWVYIQIEPHTLGVDQQEKPAEVILYQEHDGVKSLVHIQTVVRNCTISFLCI